MSVRRTRFGFRARAASQPETRVEIFQPTLGFDGGQAAQELERGFTPRSQNFVVDGGFLTPRSGLSSFGTQIGDAVVGGNEEYDVLGQAYGTAFSARTFALLPANAASWSTLSYVGGVLNAATLSDPLDGVYSNPRESAAIYDSTRDKQIVVSTNGLQWPKFFTLTPSTTTFSDFTYINSQASKAAAVAAFDNRLVFFNVVSSSSTYPQRVLWSARGNPLDFTLAGGAGFEDLMEMRGEGLKVVSEDDGILLFTEEEIWRGRRRLDAYAFDFYPVVRGVAGAFPRTVAKTPFGVVYLARDYEVYALRGNSLQALGPKAPGEHSRIQSYIRDNIANRDYAFAYYNSEQRRYELYFPHTGDSSLFPRRAFFYHFDNNSWLEQTFPVELSHGYELKQIERGATWDDLSQTWDSYNVEWNNADLGRQPQMPVVFSSVGTIYRSHSSATTDAGTAIDCRWRSHGLAQGDQFRYDQLYEVWTEFKANSASSLSVMVSEDLGASFMTDGRALALSASSGSVAFAPVWATAQSPQFEIRLNDGGQPRISRLQARIRDAGLWPGGL